MPAAALTPRRLATRAARRTAELPAAVVGRMAERLHKEAQYEAVHRGPVERAQELAVRAWVVRA